MTASSSATPMQKLRPNRLSARDWRNIRTGLLFTMPWIIGMLIFTLYPILASFYYSFTQYDIVSPPKFIGLENFRVLFTEDQQYHKAISNTAFYALIAIPMGLLVSFSVAMLLNMKVRGLAVYRTVFYLPSILPEIAAAVLWMWILNTQYGLLNQTLKLVGIKSIGWLTNPLWTKPSLILISLWAMGSSLVIFLAALQDIPQHLYEAADIDGATSWQKTLRITIPMITPTIFFNLVLGVIAATQYFTTAFVILGAGPLESTRFYMYHLYQNAFRYFKMGYASAMALLLFLFVLLVTIILFKTSGKWVYYERGR